MTQLPKNPIALILAAGSASRFAPFSLGSQHKALISVGGKTILEHTLIAVASAGLKEVVVVKNPANVDIEKVCGDGSALGLKLTYIDQPEPLGAGNAILAAQAVLKREFLVMNPNHINSALLLKSMLQALSQEYSGVLVGRETSEPWHFGVLKLKGEQIVDIIEKPEAGKEPSKTRLVGLYLLRPDFLTTLVTTPTEEYSFEKALSSYIKSNKVRLILTEQETVSLKYPWDLFSILRKVSEGNKAVVSPKAKVSKTAIIFGPVVIEEGAIVHEYAVIKGPCYIGRNSVVGDHALIRENSFIEAGASVGPYTEVTRSLIMERSSVHSGYVGDSIIGRDCEIGAGFITANRRFDRERVKVVIKGIAVSSGQINLGALLGHEVRIGVRVATMPGVAIGARATIGPGQIVHNNIEAEAKII